MRRTNVQHGQSRPRPGLPVWVIAVVILAAALGLGCVLGAPGVSG